MVMANVMQAKERGGNANMVLAEVVKAKMEYVQAELMKARPNSCCFRCMMTVVTDSSGTSTHVTNKIRVSSAT